MIRQGLADRELKRGKGGIRDIEFAVQLLQLVHGRADPQLRSPSTLPALRGAGRRRVRRPRGCRRPSEAPTGSCARSSTACSCQEDQQVHTLPTRRAGQDRLARVLGYRDQALEPRPWPSSKRTSPPPDAGPLDPRATVLPASAGVLHPPVGGDWPSCLSPEAVAERLQAFGFADAERTSQAVRELTRGFSRASQLMNSMLPVAPGLAVAARPIPTSGLLGLRTLATGTHRRDQLTALCRESPEAARQLCQLLGTGPRFARAFEPDDRTCSAAWPRARPGRRTQPGRAGRRVARSLTWRSGRRGGRAGLAPLRLRAEMLRIAARDVLDLAEVDITGGRSPIWPRRWWHGRPAGSSIRLFRSRSSAWAVSGGGSSPTTAISTCCSSSRSASGPAAAGSRHRGRGLGRAP